MTGLYPLRFRPIFRRYVWGGRRLGTLLGKPIGAGADYAESWEVVDHGDDQSVVAAGPLAGTGLHELVSQRGPELLGDHHLQAEFPLLLKYLDAHRNLSVQVHPDDARAAKLQPPDRGKTEAWVILDAAPESQIYAGLKAGVDRATLAREVRRGHCEQCLHHFHPEPGQTVFVPAGVVHALGAGLLVAEVQQASDTTYRLYDWNRLGSDGRPRQLHIEQALEAIDYECGPVEPKTPSKSGPGPVSRLITCDKFVMDRLDLNSPHAVASDHRMHILTVIDGAASYTADGSFQTLAKGQTLLLGAAQGETLVHPRGQAVLLDIYLP